MPHFPFPSEEEVTGGIFNFTARYGKQPSILLIQEKLELCDIAQEVNMNCPLQIGQHSFTYTNRLPIILPQVS